MLFFNFKNLSVITIFLSLSACSATIKIESQKDVNYAKTLKKIFVLNDVAVDFDSDFNTPFETKMNDIANSCQVQLFFYHSSSLSLEDNSLEKMKAFGSDGVMSIKHEYATKTSTLTWEATYDIRVVDADSHKVIWRAKTDFKRTGTLYQALNKQAEAFAIRITNKLKEDKVLVGCPLIAEEAGGASRP